MFLIILTGILTLGIIPLWALSGFAIDFICENLFKFSAVDNNYWNYVLLGLCITVCIKILSSIFKK